MLNVIAKMNASASGLEIFARRRSLRFDTVSADCIEPTVMEPVPEKIVLNTPSAPSLPRDDAMNATNVCHFMPKNIVTGSIARPILNRIELSAFPLLVNDRSKNTVATISTTLNDLKNVSFVLPKTNLKSEPTSAYGKGEAP